MKNLYRRGSVEEARENLQAAIEATTEQYNINQINHGLLVNAIEQMILAYLVKTGVLVLAED